MQPVELTQQIKRLHGGSQAHMMRAADGHFYAVKFRGNPQCNQVLINELVASHLARMIGLSAPKPQPVYLSKWLSENSTDLRFQSPYTDRKIEPGVHFGTRWACNPWTEPLFDYLPQSMLFERCENLPEFLGMLCLDKWLGNADGRQCVFHKPVKSKTYRAAFVDHGYCFNADQWNFPDLALHGVYYLNQVYASVTGWESFEPWLSKIESIGRSRILRLADQVPAEWLKAEDWRGWESGRQPLMNLLTEVAGRTGLVRKLIENFRHSSRNPFPNWKEEN